MKSRLEHVRGLNIIPDRITDERLTKVFCPGDFINGAPCICTKCINPDKCKACWKEKS